MAGLMTALLLLFAALATPACCRELLQGAGLASSSLEPELCHLHGPSSLWTTAAPEALETFKYLSDVSMLHVVLQMPANQLQQLL
jgi:hypothetical protein